MKIYVTNDYTQGADWNNVTGFKELSAEFNTGPFIDGIAAMGGNRKQVGIRENSSHKIKYSETSGELVHSNYISSCSLVSYMLHTTDQTLFDEAIVQHIQGPPAMLNEDEKTIKKWRRNKELLVLVQTPITRADKTDKAIQAWIKFLDPHRIKGDILLIYGCTKMGNFYFNSRGDFGST